jgi:nucleoid-associated protein YgaU
MFVRVLALALAVLVFWAVFARSSDGASPERSYVVRAGDTLWAIAERHYGGDPREGVWRIRERNELGAGPLRPGTVLYLPARAGGS